MYHEELRRQDAGRRKVENLMRGARRTCMEYAGIHIIYI